MWSVRVDADIGADLTEELAAALGEVLADRSPAIAAGHVAGRRVPGRVSAQLTVETSTLRQATSQAMHDVEAAIRGQGLSCTLVRVEAMPYAELEAELEEPQVPELVGVREIGEILAVTRQRADVITKTWESFPQPVARLASGSVWTADAVRRWATKWDRRPVHKSRKTAG